MKVLFSSVVALVAAFAVLGSPQAVGRDAAVDLAPDRSFESNPSTSYYTDGPATFTWAADDFHTGSHSLKIDSSAPSGAMTRWMSRVNAIPARAGTTYTASAFVKIAWTNGPPKANVSIDFWDASGRYLGVTADSAHISRADDWTALVATATAPAQTAYIRVEFRLFGPGTLWIDDASVATATGVPTNTALPQVSGPAQPDYTMTATTGVWTGAPTSLSYQWYWAPGDSLNFQPIPGETAASLHLPLDLGNVPRGLTDDSGVRNVEVVVVATNAAGSSTRAVSEPVAVPTDYVVFEPPTIEGPSSTTPGFTIGSTLVAVGPARSGGGIVSGATWLRCNGSGGECFTVATGSSYVVGAADVGHRLRVVFYETLYKLTSGARLAFASEPTPVITAR